MVTLKEVAKRAGVSIATVSNVLHGSVPVSEERRKRVLKVIQELDYHPNLIARSLKSKHSRMIGLVIPDICNPFFPQLARGAEDAAWECGYSLVIFNTDDQVQRELQALDTLRSRRIDGVLLVTGVGGGASDGAKKMRDAEIPIVALDRKLSGFDCDSVMVDNRAGARECVRSMIQAGHKRIAIICGPSSIQNARERLQGYKEALRAAGLKEDSSLIRYGDYRNESGYRCALELLKRDRAPDAIFASNGTMAQGVLEAIAEVGAELPGKFALGNFDDLRNTESVKLPIFSVSQPVYQIGYSGSKLLIGRLEGEMKDQKPVHLKLPTVFKGPKLQLSSKIPAKAT
jgi:LacI family transcriptional regulator